MIEDEKKIQEMAQLGTMDCRGKDCIKCQQNHPHEICWSYRRAKMYYQEGYRKEDEVIKETAKWIYKALLGTEHIKELEQKEHCEWWVSMWRLEDLNRVFKEFGVEVEEWPS